MRMTAAEISICRGSAPWRAQAGSEWCMLCQLSPSESRAGGHKLVAQSWRRVVNGRVPITWHVGLTLQVTCCTKVTRTSPAHSRVPSAARQLPPIAPARRERQPERDGAPGGERGRDRPHGRVGHHVRGVARSWGGGAGHLDGIGAPGRQQDVRALAGPAARPFRPQPRHRAVQQPDHPLGSVPHRASRPMLHDGQAQQAARQADRGGIGIGIGAQQHGMPSRSGRPRCPDPGTARRLVPALAVVAGRQGSAQMVVRLMSLPSSMRWPGTS
jgi:hypothetical protein